MLNLQGCSNSCGHLLPTFTVQRPKLSLPGLNSSQHSYLQPALQLCHQGTLQGSTVGKVCLVGDKWLQAGQELCRYSAGSLGCLLLNRPQAGQGLRRCSADSLSCLLSRHRYRGTSLGCLLQASFWEAACG